MGPYMLPKKTSKFSPSKSQPGTMHSACLYGSASIFACILSMRGVPVTALSVVGLGYIPVNLKRCQFLDFSQDLSMMDTIGTCWTHLGFKTIILYHNYTILLQGMNIHNFQLAVDKHGPGPGRHFRHPQQLDAAWHVKPSSIVKPCLTSYSGKLRDGLL